MACGRVGVWAYGPMGLWAVCVSARRCERMDPPSPSLRRDRLCATYETYASRPIGPISPIGPIGPIRSRRPAHSTTPTRHFAPTPRSIFAIRVPPFLSGRASRNQTCMRTRFCLPMLPSAFRGNFLNLFRLVCLYQRSQVWIETPHLGTNRIIVGSHEILPSFGAERSLGFFQ